MPWKKHAGFTLMEILMTISIISILVMAAIPSYHGLRQPAANSAMHGVAFNVQAAIATWHFNKLVDGSDTYPDNLDANADMTTCSAGGTCFDWVLESGIAESHWQKVSEIEYYYDLNQDGAYNDAGVDYVWTYSSSTGAFNGTVLP